MAADQRIKTREWEQIKAYWRARRDACARCGQPIDYDSPRYVVDSDGRRRENLWAMDVGHIVGRDLDCRDTWSVDDTQPEHAFCNRQAGSAYRHAKHGQSRPAPLTSREW